MSAPALVDLADRINAAHEEAFRHAKAAILRAIDVGDLLTQAKAQVKHGEWIPWVEANCRFGVRQAQKYLRAYEHRESLTANAHSDSPLPATIDRALASVAEPKAIQSTIADVPSPGARLAPGIHTVRLSDIKPSSLREFGVDPINGQHVDKIRESIREFGFWGGMVCRQLPDGTIEIVDGHHRAEAAWAEGFDTIAVAIADLDDVQAIVTAARANATQAGGRGAVRYGALAATVKRIRAEAKDGDDLDLSPVYELAADVFGCDAEYTNRMLKTLDAGGLIRLAEIQMSRNLGGPWKFAAPTPP